MLERHCFTETFQHDKREPFLIWGEFWRTDFILIITFCLVKAKLKDAIHCRSGECMSLKKSWNCSNIVNQGYRCTCKQLESMTWVSSHIAPVNNLHAGHSSADLAIHSSVAMLLQEVTALRVVNWRGEKGQSSQLLQSPMTNSLVVKRLLHLACCS